MKGGSKNRWRTRIGVVSTIVLALLISAVSVGVIAEPAGDRHPVARTLERLSDVLVRLEADLAALDAPKAEGMEERLEEVIGLIGELLDELGRPREGAAEDAWKARIVTFDLRLHRLVYLLEEIVERTPSTPARPRAQRSIDDLKVWLDSLIFDASAGMTAEEYEQLEDAVYRTARALGERVREMADRVAPRPVHSLAGVVDRLEELLFRLDGFLLHRLPQRP
jgi:hypothetical protein